MSDQSMDQSMQPNGCLHLNKCQIYAFCEWHLLRCHWVALGQVAPLTDLSIIWWTSPRKSLLWLKRFSNGLTSQGKPCGIIRIFWEWIWAHWWNISALAFVQGWHEDFFQQAGTPSVNPPPKNRLLLTSFTSRYGSMLLAQLQIMWDWFI